MGLRRRKQEYPPDRIYLACITKPHGLKGEVKMKLFGCNLLLMEELEEFQVGNSGNVLKLESIRGSEQNPIFKFQDVDSREASEALVGTELWIKPELLPDLEENAFYESDILHARVETVEGLLLGRVEQIIETGESDVLVIRDSSGNETLLPAILDVVKEVRKEDAVIVVEPLKEEFEENKE